MDVLGQALDLGQVFTWFVVFVSHALTTLSFKLCLEKGRRSTHKTCRHVWCWPILVDSWLVVGLCYMEIRGGTLIEWLVVGVKKRQQKLEPTSAFLGGYEQKGFDQPTKYWVSPCDPSKNHKNHISCGYGYAYKQSITMIYLQGLRGPSLFGI